MVEDFFDIVTPASTPDDGQELKAATWGAIKRSYR